MELKKYTVKREHLGFDYAHEGEGRPDKMFAAGSVRQLPAHVAKPLVDSGTLEPRGSTDAAAANSAEKPKAAPKPKTAPKPKSTAKKEPVPSNKMEPPPENKTAGAEPAQDAEGQVADDAMASGVGGDNQAAQ